MKKLLTFILMFAFFLFSNEAGAQKLTPQQQKAVKDLYKSKKTVYFKFKVNSMQEVKQLGTIITVDKFKGVEVAAHATKDQFTNFLPYNYKYTVVTNGGGTKKKSPVTTAKTIAKN